MVLLKTEQPTEEMRGTSSEERAKKGKNDEELGGNH
jgi:hypothetical protein